MAGPVDPARLLVAELVAGAFDGVSGAIRPDWDSLHKFVLPASRRGREGWRNARFPRDTRVTCHETLC